MLPATKRRKPNVNDAPRISAPLDLSITGKECRVQLNKLSRSLQDGGHLIQLSYSVTNNSCCWNNDDDDDNEKDVDDTSNRQQRMYLLVDRHDARTLMDDLSLHQLCYQRSDTLFNKDGVINKACCLHLGASLEEEGSEEDIKQRDIERFGMLSSESQACDPRGNPGVEEKNGKEDHKDAGENSKDDNDEPFEPTERLRCALPNDIVLPRTMRHHNIIELTAARVVNNPQLEIFLKLKQADNADLLFINPSNDLHPYYLFLKGKCSSANQVADEGEPFSDLNRSSGLDGLLAGYASASSDEETNRVVKPTKDVPVEYNTSIPREQNYDESKRKAERLERLRQWKESKKYIR